MNKYGISILEKLLTKYENSKISKGGSTKNIHISLPFDSKNMNDYVCEDSYQYESLIEEAVCYLEDRKVICVERYKSGLIKRLLLNLDYIEKAYELIKRKSKNDIETEYRTILEAYSNQSELVKKFCILMISRIDSYQSHKSYFDSIEELKEILTILFQLENQKEEISMRNFSARYLNDSKRLERIKSKIIKIIREITKENQKYVDIIDAEEDDNVLNQFNVFENPTFIYIRGKGIFQVNNQRINLREMGGELVLNSNQLEKLSVLEIESDSVITVENMTTFYDFPNRKSLIVYLGGFHNHVRREFLLKLKKSKGELQFYHAGDIDAGGFYILDHLIQKTGISFIPIKMDKETLEKYKKYTKSLTKEDQNRLNNLKKKERMKNYFSTIDYMLLNNVKLEQENIDYNR